MSNHDATVLLSSCFDPVYTIELFYFKINFFACFKLYIFCQMFSMVPVVLVDVQQEDLLVYEVAQIGVCGLSVKGFYSY